jgi:hypothetical protein
MTAAASGGLYGPPVPDGFQFAGAQAQPSFWDSFTSNLGTAFAGAAISFAFSLAASRRSGDGPERAPGFGVIGLEDRFGRGTYNDNRNVTNIISPTPRIAQQNFRQQAEQRLRRF